MPMPAPDRIRTVAVVGHSHDGKTTLCEALLHTAGATPRLGSTDQGTSILELGAGGAASLHLHQRRGGPL